MDDASSASRRAPARRTRWNRWPLIYILAVSGLAWLVTGIQRGDMRGLVAPAIVLLVLTGGLAVRLHRSALDLRKWSWQWVLWPARIVSVAALAAAVGLAIFVTWRDDWFWVDAVPDIEATRVDLWSARNAVDVTVSTDGAMIAGWTRTWQDSVEKSELALSDSFELTRRAIEVHLQGPLSTFSPDGDFLATVQSKTQWSYEVILWRLPHLERISVSTPRGQTATDLAFSPDGAQLWLSCFNGTILSYDVPSLEERSTKFFVPNGPVRIAFASNGRLVSSGGDPTVRVWDTISRKNVAILRGHAAPIWSIAVAPDGRIAASASDDGTVRLWDLVAFRQKAILIQAPGCSFRSVGFSPDGRLLVARGFRETVRGLSLALGQRPLVDDYKVSEIIVWNVESQRVVKRWSSHEFHSSDVEFCGSDKLLAIIRGEARLLRLP